MAGIVDRSIALVLATLAGTLSWFLVERPFVQLKPRSPLRGGAVPAPAASTL